MKKTETKPKISFEEANEIALKRSAELQNLHKCGIIELLFDIDDEWIYGYFKEPTRMQIMKIMGKAGVDPLFSGEALLESNLIREASDARFLDPSPLYNKINITAFLIAYASTNQITTNLIEKKTGK